MNESGASSIEIVTTSTRKSAVSLGRMPAVCAATKSTKRFAALRYQNGVRCASLLLPDTRAPRTSTAT
jgi:hypothetical protein